MRIRSMEQLLAVELGAIRDAETQAAEALEVLGGEATQGAVQKILQRRMKQGERLLKEVEGALGRMEEQPKSQTNAAARGIIQEGQKRLKAVDGEEMKEAVAIAAVQALEHYCIALWGTARALADEAGEDKIARTLERAVEEGYQLDRELTEIAERRVNPEAAGDKKRASGAEGGETAGREAKEGDGGGKGRKSAPGDGENADGGDSSDLKSREYRDSKGNIHHHTRKYMERKSG